MRVILLQDIRGLGKKNDIKEVSDGHARNMLIPNGLAKQALPGKVKEVEIMKSKQKKEEEELEKHLHELARTLNDRYIEFELKSDKKGSIFGAVNKEMILKAMRDHGLISKERVDVKLEHPLKEAGEHYVVVDFKKGIEAKLKVIVRPQQ